MSTPRTLDRPDPVRRVSVQTGRGAFAALEAIPGSGVCERQPALLLPGYTGSKEDFLTVLQPLAAAGRRVVAVDMRGQYETPGTSRYAGTGRTRSPRTSPRSPRSSGPTAAACTCSATRSAA